MLRSDCTDARADMCLCCSLMAYGTFSHVWHHVKLFWIFWSVNWSNMSKLSINKYFQTSINIEKITYMYYLRAKQNSSYFATLPLVLFLICLYISSRASTKVFEHRNFVACYQKGNQSVALFLSIMTIYWVMKMVKVSVLLVCPESADNDAKVIFWLLSWEFDIASEAL